MLPILQYQYPMCIGLIRPMFRIYLHISANVSPFCNKQKNLEHIQDFDRVVSYITFNWF